MTKNKNRYWMFDSLAVVALVAIDLALLIMRFSWREIVAISIGILGSYVLARMSFYFHSINVAKPALRRLITLYYLTHDLDKYILDSEGTNFKARLLTVTSYGEIYRKTIKDCVQDWNDIFPDIDRSWIELKERRGKEQ